MVNGHDRVYKSPSFVSTGLTRRKVQLELARRECDLNALGVIGIGERQLRQLIVIYYNSDGVSKHFALHLNQLLGGLQRGIENLSDQESLKIQKDLSELRGAQREFRAAVSWLCSPKEPLRTVTPQETLKLLKTNQWEWGRYPDVDRKTESFIRYFESHGLKHFRLRASLQDNRLLLCPRFHHLIDLFCAFLLGQCQGKLPDEMPITLCQQCGKLFFARGVKKFCSAKCHDKHFWTKERKADYAYLDRLEDCSVPDLRKRLKEPKVQQRLAEIETRWPAWNSVAEKIKSFRKIADQKKN